MVLGALASLDLFKSGLFTGNTGSSVKKKLLKWLGKSAVESGLIIPLAHNLIRGYLSLMRIEVIGEERMLSHLRGGGKAIAALWHQRILGVVSYAAVFQDFRPRP